MNVAPVERQLLDARMLDDGGHGRAGCGYERRDVPGDGDRGGRSSQFQHGLHHGGLAGQQAQRALPCIHPGRFDGDLILSHLNRREKVEADFVGLGLVLAAGGGVDNGDCGAGNHGPRGVLDYTVNFPRAGMREAQACCDQQDGRKKTKPHLKL